jgi:hypothetical protein
MVTGFKKREWSDAEREQRIIVERFRGRTATGIAKKLHLSITSIQNVLHKPYIDAKLAELKELALQKTIQKEAENSSNRAVLNESRDILERFSAKAARKIRRIADKGVPADRIQLEACQDILDRVGVKGNLVTEIINRNYTPEEIESAKQTLLEVESISARVTMSRSRFALPEQGQPTQNTDQPLNQQSQDATTRPIPTSPDGQETLPEESLLPL